MPTQQSPAPTCIFCVPGDPCRTHAQPKKFTDRLRDSGFITDTPKPAASSRATPVDATSTGQAYAIATLNRLAGEVAMAQPGTINDTLNRKALRAYRVADAHGLDRQTVTDTLQDAVRRAGGTDTAKDESTLKSARAGADKYGPAHKDPGDAMYNATDFGPDPAGASGATDQDAGDPASIGYTDFGALLAGAGLPDPPKPSVLRREDDVAIFYHGKRNDLYGDPEDGKTMVALAGGTQELRAGGNVLFLDLDSNGPAETAQRMIMLGADPAVLADRNRFRHIEPGDADEVLRVVADCAGWATTVILDCVGELMPMFRANSDRADEYTHVMQKVSSPLEHGGAAVILLDHQAKGNESRAYGSGGTMAKRRAISGASINLVRKQTFTPGKGGMADLWINKDRPGGLRAHCPKSEGRRQFAGTFILDAPAVGGVAGWRVTVDRAEIPAESIDPVVERHHDAAIALGDEATVAEIATRANGLPPDTPPTRSQKETARRALATLERQGRLVLVTGVTPKRWQVAA